MLLFLRREVVAALLCVGALVTFAACGSSSGDGSSSAASVPSSTDSDEPSAEFAGKGENGELATAGIESTVEEREAASRVVEANLEARAEGDYEGQCETLAPEMIERLEERGNGIVKTSCVKSLEGLAKRASPESLKNPMTEPLAAMRVNGNLAFAFFHGAGGKNHVILMEQEGSEWKVASLSTQETPGS
ncbi:MAG TPA: hypothetical protein VMS60_00665 [Solirubrobacterales bacterium]|nr:hypothetical protein [Solirubrobacterales bacterium]